MKGTLPDENWAACSADLPARCREFAKVAAERLRSVVCSEAENLAKEGFMVPSRESLLHASVVFSNIAALSGGERWLQRPNPVESIHLVCAVAGSVDSFENEWDLDALSTWWEWRDSEGVLAQALGARAMVNAGQFERVLALLKADIQRAERDYGAAR